MDFTNCETMTLMSVSRKLFRFANFCSVLSPPAPGVLSTAFQSWCSGKGQCREAAYNSLLSQHGQDCPGEPVPYQSLAYHQLYFHNSKLLFTIIYHHELGFITSVYLKAVAIPLFMCKLSSKLLFLTVH